MKTSHSRNFFLTVGLRLPVLAALMLLLLSGQARAQIALIGNAPTITATAEGPTTESTTIVVPSGASVLVVCVETHSAGTTVWPATITFNSQTLTLIKQELDTSSSY